jgi:hypothetical protein
MNRTAFILLAALTVVSLSAQEPTDRERALLDRIAKLEQRLAAVEAKTGIAPASLDPQPVPAASTPPTAAAILDSPSLPGFVPGTTVNFNFDGYYGYNFNRPLGGVNLLRANDVTSNNFTLNQADLVVERAADAAAGRRLGFRLDLMFGQNTETLQGGSQNEPRPQVYRNIFQAYGTYILPVGSGLTVDFGKFASALGFENNYVKDQFNYSRSYYFNFLPFYHMGFRSTYNFNDKLSLQYWLVNGANQTEDFNGFKSNAFLFTVKPTRNISWNVNYYFGEEGRALVPDLNPGLPLLPTQPGLSTTPILPAPNGREHIFDSYVQWNATAKLTLAAEADYVLNRAFTGSAPARVAGFVAYLKYQITPRFAFSDRFEYLSDQGGLFSGITQVLKEDTGTLTYQPADGFQIRAEYRRDFSDRPFFLTNAPGLLKREQNTATLGMIWWFGGKQGPW